MSPSSRPTTISKYSLPAMPMSTGRELRLAVAQHEDALLVFLLRLERGRGGARLGRQAGRELGSLYSEIKAIIAMGKYFPDDGLPHWKVPAGKPS